ncbi:hypothetical protein [Bacillus solimangrovi]|nr:hypothetical protein [Bacillus solimangrovi]
MFNLIASLSSMIITKSMEVPLWIAFTILLYSFIRILEITVYQVNVLLFDPYQNAGYSVRSYRRLVILLLHNYVEVIFWFATSYMIMSEHLNILISKGTITDTLLFSFLTMVTFGANSMSSIQHIGHLIIFVQAVIGLFMTIITLARFIGLLPRPASQDEKENYGESLEKEIQQLKEEIRIMREQITRKK